VPEFLETAIYTASKVLELLYVPFERAGWPLTTFLVVLFLGRPVMRTIASIRISKIKAGGVEVEIEMDVVKAPTRPQVQNAPEPIK
jgi:hypothetical protein